MSKSNNIRNRLDPFDGHTVFDRIVQADLAFARKGGWARFAKVCASEIPRGSRLERTRNPRSRVEEHVDALRTVVGEAVHLELVSRDDDTIDLIVRPSPDMPPAQQRAVCAWLAAECSLATVHSHDQRSLVGVRHEAGATRIRIVPPIRVPFFIALLGRFGDMLNREFRSHHQMMLTTGDLTEEMTDSADASEARLARALDVLDEGYFEWADGRLVVSPRFVALCGIDVDSLDELRSGWIERTPIEHLEHNVEAFDQLFTSAARAVVLPLIVDDELRYFELRVRHREDRITGTLLDDTERHAAYVAASRRRNTLRSLLRASPFSIAVHRDNEVVFANDSFDTELRDYIGAITSDTVRLSVSRTSLLPERELSITTETGDVRHYELTSSMIDWDGEGAFLTVFRDITEERAFLVKSFELDRVVAIGTLADGVSHEINNPLAYVQSNVEYASREIKRSGVDATDELTEILRDVLDGTERVSDLVNDFRALSPGPASSRCRPVQLEEVITSARNLASATIRSRANVSTMIDLPGKVLASESRLGQVLINLMVNAAQAMPDGRRGDIRIIARVVDNDRARIEVRDNGTGIPEGDLEKVLKPFFTTKPIGEGTGLGLSICRNLMEAMDGSLDIESEFGVGTTIVLHLPLAAEIDIVPEPAGLNEASERLDSVPAILVIDDDVNIGRTVRRVLDDIADVTVLRDPLRALDLARESTFDLVLVDVLMPNMTGIELIEKLISARPEYAGRIVVMTGGNISEENASRDDVSYLSKPFGMRGLRRAIRAGLQPDEDAA